MAKKRNNKNFFMTNLNELNVGGLFTCGPHRDLCDYNVFIKYSDHIVSNPKTDPPNIMPINSNHIGHHAAISSKIHIIGLCNNIDEDDLPLVACLHKRTDSQYDKDTFIEICEYFYKKYIEHNKNTRKPSIYNDIV